MFFKTKSESQTGQKLIDFSKRVDKIQQQIAKEIHKIGAINWRPDPKLAGTGVISIKFPGNFNPGSSFSKSSFDGEFKPSKANNAGKKIQEMLDVIPTLTNKELNACVGLVLEDPNNAIGYKILSDGNVLIEASVKWDFTAPEDCEEITFKEYKEILQTVESGS